jgi:hypothetical protein
LLGFRTSPFVEDSGDQGAKKTPEDLLAADKGLIRKSQIPKVISESMYFIIRQL